MKKITALVLLVALISALMVTPASAKSKTSEIDDYISATFDVYNVPLVASTIEFQEGIDDGSIKPAITDNTTNRISYTITAKNDGCLLIKSSCFIDIFENKSKKSVIIGEYITTNSSAPITSNGASIITLRKGDEVSICKHSGHASSDMQAYIAFVPITKLIHIDESVKNSNKTLTFTFGNVYGPGTILSVYATKNKLSIRDVIGGTITPMYNKATMYNFEYTSVDQEGDAVLTLPEEGEYSLYIKLSYDYKTLYNNSNTLNPIIACGMISLDTDKYIKPTLDKLESPISAIYGTNVIVGYAEPSATVYVEYEGQKYQQKANRRGIYRIVIDEDMKEGTPFKIWQSKNKLTSEKVKYRVTDNV